MLDTFYVLNNNVLIYLWVLLSYSFFSSNCIMISKMTRPICFRVIFVLLIDFLKYIMVFLNFILYIKGISRTE